eukprot:NODE_7623_length_429_cov_204.796791.p5 GENE.NODE_7623_length_429_cov_204.796791~~NODE_7623_length_429_cov_204.796791.p5  ORF type:complete len:52 (+),score=8.42 NODE_7623_length_429_cov_204.796791:3-158(+)
MGQPAEANRRNCLICFSGVGAALLQLLVATHRAVVRNAEHRAAPRCNTSAL